MATILVVDDELGIRALLSEILTDEGHTVEVAEDAAQARQLREQFKPDLVLLDIWMPDVDGITLLKEWGSAGYLSMPVIMMSGHGTIDTAVEAMKFGASAFLEKPVTLQKLLRAVEDGLSRGPDVRGLHGAAGSAGGSGPTGGAGGAGTGSSAPYGLSSGQRGEPMAAAGLGGGGAAGGNGYGAAGLAGSGHGGFGGAGPAGGGGLGAGSMAAMPGMAAGAQQGVPAGPAGGPGATGFDDPTQAFSGLSASQQVFELDRPLREARDAFEKSYFEYHLARENGSMTRVAEKTGLERTHLYRKLKHLGVDLSRTKRSSH